MSQPLGVWTAPRSCPMLPQGFSGAAPLFTKAAAWPRLETLMPWESGCVMSPFD